MIERHFSAENEKIFDKAIWDTISHFRKEYDFTYAQMIGLLECIKLDLWNETNEDRESLT